MRRKCKNHICMLGIKSLTYLSILYKYIYIQTHLSTSSFGTVILKCRSYIPVEDRNRDPGIYKEVTSLRNDWCGL